MMKTCSKSVGTVVLGGSRGAARALCPPGFVVCLLALVFAQAGCIRQYDDFGERKDTVASEVAVLPDGAGRKGDAKLEVSRVEDGKPEATRPVDVVEARSPDGWGTDYLDTKAVEATDGKMPDDAGDQSDAPEFSCGEGGCFCGDGGCTEVLETCCNCPEDCGSCCGNGVCDCGENQCTCKDDCGDPCGGNLCGDDGCGGSCGSCPEGQTCQAGQCKAVCGDGKCAEAGVETCCNCPADCGSCCGNGGCDCGENKCTCTEDCGEPCAGKQCGDDGCGATCGTCPAGKSCQAGQCEVTCGDWQCALSETCSGCPADCGACCGQGGCQAQFGETKCVCPVECGDPCAGLECGDDGCGGSCGTCDDGQLCVDHACTTDCGNGFCGPGETCATCPYDCGCHFLFKDWDQDTFGTLVSQCLCSPGGDYTAVRAGDCNDGDEDINPDASENCATEQDDDCDGETDIAVGPVNCTSWYKDKDQDGFGAGEPVCLCGPQSVYTAANDDDCDDTNGKVFPGQTEKCSTDYDDNCNDETNEADAEGCTSFWVDQDGDGYAGTAMCYCVTPANAEDFPEDCCDADPMAHPDQTKHYDVPVNWCGGYDYNCDGDEESQYNSSCVEAPCSAGWFQPTPACGQAGNWCLNCSGCGSCLGQTIQQKQKCR